MDDDRLEYENTCWVTTRGPDPTTGKDTRHACSIWPSPHGDPDLHECCCGFKWSTKDGKQSNTREVM